MFLLTSAGHYANLDILVVKSDQTGVAVTEKTTINNLICFCPTVPTVIKAFKGQNVTLLCYGDTRHDVKDVKWKKDGQRVLLYTHANRSVTTDEASESRFMMSVESFLGGDLSLHISSVHLSDAGLYQCLLHDESQDGEPRAVLLTVEGKLIPYSNVKYLQNSKAVV